MMNTPQLHGFRDLDCGFELGVRSITQSVARKFNRKLRDSAASDTKNQKVFLPETAPMAVKAMKALQYGAKLRG
jgi:hypothetical protein